MYAKVGAPDFDVLHAQTEEDIAGALHGAIEEGGRQFQADWRQEIVRAGLGQKLANTVRRRTYPEGQISADAAALIWSKAPVLADVHGRGATILPKGGRFYLAIPSKHVPRKGRRRMTPAEVEVAFNQDLIIRRSRNGNLVAYVDTALARFSTQHVRPYGDRRRVLKNRPKPKLVLMFTLVLRVIARRRYDLDAVAARGEARVPVLITERWLRIPDRAAPVRFSR